MDGLMGVLQTVLPVLAMLGLGMLCRRTALLSREGVGALKRVVMDITLPAVLFNAFATARYGADSLILPVVMFAICLSSMLLGRLGARVLGLKSRFVPFLTSGYEAGMLGYALFALLYGKDNLPAFAMLDLGQVLFVFTVYKGMLGAMNGEADAKKAVRDILTAPTIWAMALGVLFGATGLYSALIPSGVGGVIDAITDFISGPTGAIILLAIGYDLVFRDIRWKATATTVGLRLLIQGFMMGLMLLINHLWLHAGAAMTGAIALMFLLPPPYVLPIIADDANERAYVSSALSVATLFAIAAFAIMAWRV